MDSDVAGVPLLNSDVADDHLLISDVADTHFPNSVGSDADNESSAASSVSTSVYLGSDEVESALAPTSLSRVRMSQVVLQIMMSL